MSIHLINTFEDSLAQLVQRCDPGVTQEASRHLALELRVAPLQVVAHSVWLEFKGLKVCIGELPSA